MDRWKRFKDNKLPDKESFYSKLNNVHINDDDYAHSQKVYDIFNIKNLGEYHDLYVQSDTAQLADAFENFRNTCLEMYELDPAHLKKELEEEYVKQHIDMSKQIINT